MRYTEARLSPLAEEMLRDIEKETVDFQPNFDNTLKEPVVLPTRLPNLLVNGSAGIAVGMATNMPPHNLGEVCDGIVAYIENPDLEISDLMKYIKAPDFPTGGSIYGYAGVKEAYETGRGRVVVRSKVEIETDEHGHERLVITEIPYQVIKSDLVKDIAALVNEKRIEGIAGISDQTNREGIRIVIDIKRDANANVVLNKLYKFTALQSSFGVNNIALVHGRPYTLNLKELIKHFVDHRLDVVTRRTQFELRKAEDRAHIVQGLIIAVDNIDEVIQIIKSSRTVEEARNNLMNRFALSDIQARAIVEMRLRQLTGLAIDDLRAEYEELEKTIAHLKEVLAHVELRMEIIKEETIALKEKFKTEYVIDVLLGKETSQVLSYQHEDLEVFGSGQGEDERTWNAVIRQALIAGYISKDIENYGLLKVTKAGHAFLKNPVSFKIVKDVDFEEMEEEVPMKGGAACAVDPELYAILKDLRKKIAKRLELPPYVIFQDPSLEAMATTYPITLEELQNIPGVGAGKAKRYGEEFIKVIKAHVEENEIERPEDLRVRTVANKSKLKVSIIQAIDRKIALDELAESKGLDFSELLDEIEAIVYSGTKINIDYFLREIMDDEHIDDIFNYFKESESDSLEDAIEEFGMEYSEEEIRLIRIKFLSEMGN